MRIVTINTWKGEGPYRSRLEALAEGLTALDPDIVALQEAIEARDGACSTPRRLADALGMHLAYHAARLKPRHVEGRRVLSWSGNAILSRWPIRESIARPLPSDPADGDRTVLFGAVESPSGLVRVGATHLTHLRDAALRTDQMEAILRDPRFDLPASSSLVCGDLNAVPDSEEIGRLLSGSHGRSVRDCLGHLPDAARATISPRNPYVAARRPGLLGRAVDYVLSVAPSERDHPRVLKAGIVLDSPGSAGVFPGDHFGVSIVVE